MPAIPEAPLLAAALAIHRAACPLRDDPDHDCARDAAHEEMLMPRARAALEAAAPLLAEAVAQKILAHMEHFADPAVERLPLAASLRAGALRRHFQAAARIAAGTFDTREDQLRMAAQAIERGDWVRCDIPEVPRG